ncbi:MAG: tRNA uridine-5-carboxymethylaminomethyl(34) synthesis GTPase MnmE [Deltaproteobacteria bacterium]|nr:tRNA uridine-5-carboxymethylaminomethyl(34) synthesis GTPase MnmE [Deltaproteobacteria bacterium]
MYASDTIAAVATPPGAGGIGIVRLSGPHVGEIAARMFRAQAQPATWASHRLYRGSVIDAQGRTLDEGLAVIMRAPHSYTGEDVLELHCHGSPAGLRRVIMAVLAHGARLAEPGEFTRRAFLNGRLDLAQAEAIVELIAARSEEGAAIGADHLAGRLSHALNEIRQGLLDIRARIEVQIDFSDEDVRVDQGELTADIERAHTQVVALRDSYRHGKLVRQGLRVVITGKPNAGKSSLLNALLRAERAIVTSIPGTTRDVIEEAADFHGIPVLLSDTAGIRQPGDSVEQLGVSRARAKLAEAEVVLAVFDRTRPLDRDDAEVAALARGLLFPGSEKREPPRQLLRQVVAVLNKSDLPAVIGEGELCDQLGLKPAVNVSAVTGAGLDALRAAVVTAVEQQSEVPANQPIVTLTRHHDALAKAGTALQLALDGVRQCQPLELVAVDIQRAADQLAEITGSLTSEDVLDRIFAQFCIGK